jgi:hypothetical protein
MRRRLGLIHHLLRDVGIFDYALADRIGLVISPHALFRWLIVSHLARVVR